MIMGKYMKVRYIGGRVYVAGVPKHIDRILDISGVYKIVSKCDNVFQALKEC